MNLRNFRFYIAFFVGRFTYYVMRLLRLDATTFPGKLALNIYPDFLREIKEKIKTRILVTGTNGKTTTNNLIYFILSKKNFKVLSNLEGANLKSGIATSFIKNPGEYDFASFEVDEGIFPFVLNEIDPQYVLINNFFRDQLDRYGEIDTTVDKILNAFSEKEQITLILNADDPFVVRFADLPNRKYFYGISKKIGSSDSKEIKESVYCPKCGRRLNYEFFNYAQIGRFFCECGFKNPSYDFYIDETEFKDRWFFSIKEKEEKVSLSFNFPGVYNLYNALSAYSLGRALGVSKEELSSFISDFYFKLGRLEKFIYKDLERILVLVKNPAGYNQVLDTIKRDASEKVLLLILNDNIADGRDVSWIWDVDFEKIKDEESIKKIICSGKRAEDLLVRLKYAEIPLEKIQIINNIESAVLNILGYSYKTYILPTYTALFKTRKIILRETKNET
ncbi:MAG TPA: MurT ligase domain-containing protein [Dictyoglomaceae bacterium]|nr:MurT ligase domain-containing protein [Dictyoglomaceae bacterium]